MGSMAQSMTSKGRVSFTLSSSTVFVCAPLLLHAHRPEAQAEDTGGHAAHQRYAEQKTQPARRSKRLLRTQHARQHPTLDLGLNHLNKTGWQFAPALHRSQIPCVQIFELRLALPQWFRKHVCCDYGVLDGVVDPNPSDRTHHVGGVPGEQQPRPVPARAAARLDREQRCLLPVLQMLDAIRKLRYQLREAPPERPDPLLAQLGEGPFGYDVAGLPVLIAVEQDRNVSPPDAPHRALWVILLPWQLEPQDVHRRRGLYGLEASQTPQAAPAPIGAHSEHCPHLAPPILTFVADTPDHAVLLDELPNPRSHREAEVRVPFRFSGNELEEARLWHHRDVRILRLQMREIQGCEGTRHGPDRGAANLRMAQLQQPLGETQLVHDLHDRRVDGVATELAVEVHVRL